eukprot:GEMP01000087.1.p1 GENE.GEMP01000087.1~~GEMP01000087.1.p1  ORF type:complete len:3210 (+),score=780.60 GEMP01000087.1:77-9706(+)
MDIRDGIRALELFVHGDDDTSFVAALIASIEKADNAAFLRLFGGKDSVLSYVEMLKFKPVSDKACVDVKKILLRALCKWMEAHPQSVQSCGDARHLCLAIFQIDPAAVVKEGALALLTLCAPEGEECEELGKKLLYALKVRKLAGGVRGSALRLLAIIVDKLEDAPFAADTKSFALHAMAEASGPKAETQVLAASIEAIDTLLWKQPFSEAELDRIYTVVSAVAVAEDVARYDPIRQALFLLAHQAPRKLQPWVVKDIRGQCASGEHAKPSEGMLPEGLISGIVRTAVSQTDKVKTVARGALDAILRVVTASPPTDDQEGCKRHKANPDAAVLRLWHAFTKMVEKAQRYMATDEKARNQVLVGVRSLGSLADGALASGVNVHQQIERFMTTLENISLLEGSKAADFVPQYIQAICHCVSVLDATEALWAEIADAGQQLFIVFPHAFTKQRHKFVDTLAMLANTLDQQLLTRLVSFGVRATVTSTDEEMVLVELWKAATDHRIREAVVHASLDVLEECQRNHIVFCDNEITSEDKEFASEQTIENAKMVSRLSELLAAVFEGLDGSWAEIYHKVLVTSLESTARYPPLPGVFRILRALRLYNTAPAVLARLDNLQDACLGEALRFLLEAQYTEPKVVRLAIQHNLGNEVLDALQESDKNGGRDSAAAPEFIALLNSAQCAPRAAEYLATRPLVLPLPSLGKTPGGLARKALTLPLHVGNSMVDVDLGLVINSLCQAAEMGHPSSAEALHALTLWLLGKSHAEGYMNKPNVTQFENWWMRLFPCLLRLAAGTQLGALMEQLLQQIVLWFATEPERTDSAALRAALDEALGAQLAALRRQGALLLIHWFKAVVQNGRTEAEKILCTVYNHLEDPNPLKRLGGIEALQELEPFLLENSSAQWCIEQVVERSLVCLRSGPEANPLIPIIGRLGKAIVPSRSFLDWLIGQALSGDAELEYSATCRQLMISYGPTWPPPQRIPDGRLCDLFAFCASHQRLGRESLGCLADQSILARLCAPPASWPEAAAFARAVPFVFAKHGEQQTFVDLLLDLLFTPERTTHRLNHAAPARQSFLDEAKKVPLAPLRRALDTRVDKFFAPLRAVLDTQCTMIHMQEFHAWVEGLEIVNAAAPSLCDDMLGTVVAKAGLSKGKHQINLLRVVLAFSGFRSKNGLKALSAAPSAFLPLMSSALRDALGEHCIFVHAECLEYANRRELLGLLASLARIDDECKRAVQRALEEGLARCAWIADEEPADTSTQLTYACEASSSSFEPAAKRAKVSKGQSKKSTLYALSEILRELPEWVLPSNHPAALWLLSVLKEAISSDVMNATVKKALLVSITPICRYVDGLLSVLQTLTVGFPLETHAMDERDPDYASYESLLDGLLQAVSHTAWDCPQLLNPLLRTLREKNHKEERKLKGFAATLAANCPNDKAKALFMHIWSVFMDHSVDTKNSEENMRVNFMEKLGLPVLCEMNEDVTADIWVLLWAQLLTIIQTPSTTQLQYLEAQIAYGVIEIFFTTVRVDKIKDHVVPKLFSDSRPPYTTGPLLSWMAIARAAKNDCAAPQKFRARAFSAQAAAICATQGKEALYLKWLWCNLDFLEPYNESFQASKACDASFQQFPRAAYSLPYTVVRGSRKSHAAMSGGRSVNLFEAAKNTVTLKQADTQHAASQWFSDGVSTVTQKLQGALLGKKVELVDNAVVWNTEWVECDAPWYDPRTSLGACVLTLVKIVDVMMERFANVRTAISQAVAEARKVPGNFSLNMALIRVFLLRQEVIAPMGDELLPFIVSTVMDERFGATTFSYLMRDVCSMLLEWRNSSAISGSAGYDIGRLFQLLQSLAPHPMAFWQNDHIDVLAQLSSKYAISNWDWTVVVKQLTMKRKKEEEMRCLRECAIRQIICFCAAQHTPPALGAHVLKVLKTCPQVQLLAAEALGHLFHHEPQVEEETLQFVASSPRVAEFAAAMSKACPGVLCGVMGSARRKLLHKVLAQLDTHPKATLRALANVPEVGEADTKAEIQAWLFPRWQSLVQQRDMDASLVSKVAYVLKVTLDEATLNLLLSYRPSGEKSEDFLKFAQWVYDYRKLDCSFLVEEAGMEFWRSRLSTNPMERLKELIDMGGAARIADFLVDLVDEKRALFTAPLTPSAIFSQKMSLTSTLQRSQFFSLCSPYARSLAASSLQTLTQTPVTQDDGDGSGARKNAASKRGHHYANKGKVRHTEYQAKMGIMLKHERKKRSANQPQTVKLSREYRLGDFPDIEITLSDLLKPLILAQSESRAVKDACVASFLAPLVDRHMVEQLLEDDFPPAYAFYVALECAEVPKYTRMPTFASSMIVEALLAERQNSDLVDAHYKALGTKVLSERKQDLGSWEPLARGVVEREASLRSAVYENRHFELDVKTPRALGLLALRALKRRENAMQYVKQGYQAFAELWQNTPEMDLFARNRLLLSLPVLAEVSGRSAPLLGPEEHLLDRAEIRKCLHADSAEIYHQLSINVLAVGDVVAAEKRMKQCLECGAADKNRFFPQVVRLKLAQLAQGIPVSVTYDKLAKSVRAKAPNACVLLGDVYEQNGEADEAYKAYARAATNEEKMKLMIFCDQSLRDGKGLPGMDVTVVETVFSLLSTNDASCSAFRKASDLLPRAIDLMHSAPDITAKLQNVPEWTLLRWIDHLLPRIEDVPSLLPALQRVAREFPQPLFFALRTRTGINQCDEVGNAIEPKLRILLARFVANLELLVHPSTRVTRLLQLHRKTRDDKYIDLIKQEPIADAGPLHIDMHKQLMAHLNQNPTESLQKVAMRAFRTEPFSSGDVPLEKFSTFLARHHFAGDVTPIHVPGQISFTQKPTDPVALAGFRKLLSVMVSQQKPKRVVMIGTDEGQYPFLLKGGEDLKLDMRIEQLFAQMNTVLPATCAKIKTYSVIPMSTDFGLVAWVPNTTTLKQAILAASGVNNINELPQTIERKKYFETFWTEAISLKLFPHLFSRPAEEVVRAHQQQVKGNDGYVRKYFWRLASSPEAYFHLRSNFSKSMGSLSACTYVLGLGDRHMDNILLDTADGSVASIDLAYSFGCGTMMLFVPELMPFRLTPNLEGAMMHHEFRQTLQDCLTAWRNNAHLLADVIHVFLIDPLHDWSQAVRDGRLHQFRAKVRGAHPCTPLLWEISQNRQQWVVQQRAQIETIIKGDGFRAQLLQQEYLTPEQHVDCLIDLARDPNILGRAWLGWMPNV